MQTITKLEQGQQRTNLSTRRAGLPQNTYITEQKHTSMNPILRNVMAVIAGVAAGTLVNGGLVTVGSNIIPAPITVAQDNLQAIAESLHLFTPKHYLFPFLAHALGTLTAAFVAVKLSTSKHIGFGLGTGVFFLLGGITAAFMIPAHTWFVVVDLLLAYLPMGWLGWKLAGGRR